MPFADKERQSVYQNAHNKVRSARERKRLKNLLGNKCVVCGTEDGLEFHHKDEATKLFTIGSALRFTSIIRTAEALKCELRCREHHVEAHAAEHGTESKYRSGCRCDPCIAGKREYNRTWMKDWRAAGLDKSRNNFTGRAEGGT